VAARRRQDLGRRGGDSSGHSRESEQGEAHRSFGASERSRSVDDGSANVLVVEIEAGRARGCERACEAGRARGASEHAKPGGRFPSICFSCREEPFSHKCGFSGHILTKLIQIITKLPLELVLPNIFQNGFSSHFRRSRRPTRQGPSKYAIKTYIL
jgi:hypothetical protein